MPPSKICPIRIDSRLRRLIDGRRGDATFSAWVREACTRRLEAEAGLGPELAAQLAEQAAQLRGLGTNLNQLARAANEGRPVVLSNKLLDDALLEIRETKALLIQLYERLPA